MIIIGRSIITNEYEFHEEYVLLIINNSSKGKFEFLISVIDYGRCSKHKWNVQITKYKDSVNTYAYTSIDGKHLFLHRFILSVDDNHVADHISGNTLDNRRENLRECTHQENCRNRKLNRNATTSGHKGVCWYKHKGYNKWKAYIKVEYQTINLGYFDNIEDAIECRKNAEIKYFGEYARSG